MDRGVEIGVVADLRRQRVSRLRLRHQAGFQRRLLRRPWRSARDRPDAVPSRLAASRHQRIQRGPPWRSAAHAPPRHRAARAKAPLPRAAPDPESDRRWRRRRETLRAAARRKTPKRQILHREIRARRIGRGDPAAQRRIVRFVQRHAFIVALSAAADRSVLADPASTVRNRAAVAATPARSGSAESRSASRT